MIRTILHHPDPRLRVKAEPISEITPEVLQLIDDMIETMIANRGAGLAATQVGEAVRIFVMKDDLSCVAFINPKISGLSGEQVGAEGCLSLPGERVTITRAHRLTIEALSQDGKPFRRKFSGYFARVIQHEVDHLEGILMIDEKTEGP